MFGEQPLLDRLWLPFTCSSAVDALGVMVANGSTTTNGQLILQTAQPTDINDCEKVLYVNGPTDVAANAYGRCTMAQAPIFALYSGDAPAAGDKMGPQATSWSLLKDNPGFLAVDAGDGTKVLVVRSMLGCWQAKWIKFTVNDGSGFASTDASVAVDGVTYIDGYEPATAITTVYNEPISSNYLFEGDDDDKGKAEYDPTNDKYWIHQMECP